MAEIIQFPSQDERDWSRIETLIRERMVEAQAPKVVINEVLSWLKVLWVKLREQPIQYQAQIPEGCYGPVIEAAQAVVGQMRDKLYLTMFEAAEQKTKLAMLKYRHNL